MAHLIGLCIVLYNVVDSEYSCLCRSYPSEAGMEGVSLAQQHLIVSLYDALLRNSPCTANTLRQ